jgi:chromosome segregation ATPase
MTAATDTDLQQVKDLITAGNAAIQQSIGDIKTDIREIKTDIKELRADVSKLDVRLARLEEKSNGMDERIDNWEGSVNKISIAILTGLLLTFGKFLFFGKV